MISKSKKILAELPLRVRALLYTGLTAAALLSATYFCLPPMLLAGYVGLEHDHTRRNVERAHLAIEQMTQELHQKCADWSAWDEAYRFLNDKNAAFINSNLTPTTLTTLDVDIVVYLNERGSLFFVGDSSRVPSLPKPNARQLIASLGFHRLANLPTDFEGKSGIVLENGLPMLFTARPVLRSDYTGATRGWCLFGRYLDATDIRRIAERTRLQAALSPLNALATQRMGGAILSGVHDPNAISIVERDSSFIEGYALLRDYRAHPIRLLSVTMPRSIYQQGRESVAYLMRFILLSALIFGVVLIGLIERIVLSRLSLLTRQVDRIGVEGSNQARIALPGGDEMARLAERINVMLAHLADHANIQANEERLRHYNETLERVVQERTGELEHKNASLQEMNAAMQYAVEGIARLDAEGRFVSVNVAFARLLGYAPEELEGRGWRERFGADDLEAIQTAIGRLTERDKSEVEAHGLRQNGTTFDAELTLTALTSGADQSGFYCFLKDISERKALEAQIAHQAFHDTLTGLPNRSLFYDRVSHALHRAKRDETTVGVLFIDLDNFKFVNDSLGHDEGDRLLQEVAMRLQDCVREADTVARLGGDEFTVLLERIQSVEEARQVAERILDRVHEPIRLKQQEVFVTPSIGIALSATTEATTDSLLRDADTAMYAAKGNGKAGYVLFDPSMNKEVTERVELETALRRALDNEELRVYYQPLVDLETGKIRGAEALVRWEHPRLGLVSPAKFIPLAEETGLIVSIGAWVLEEACRQAQHWRETIYGDETFMLSVNLSARQLQNDEIVEEVRRILGRTGLDPACLKLEITESLMMMDTEGIIQRMHALKAMGVQLAMDDFGTGYSSLSYLQQLPLDTVKIDQMLVRGISENVKTAAIVLSVIRMCRALEMDIVCEGIETAQQVVQLQTLGCDVGQGYFFSKPVPTEAFAALLEQRTLGTMPESNPEAWNQGDFIYLAA